MFDARPRPPTLRVLGGVFAGLALLALLAYYYRAGADGGNLLRASANCPGSQRIALEDVTALHFAGNYSSCVDRIATVTEEGPDGKRQHLVWQLQPNSLTPCDWVACSKLGWDGAHTHWHCECTSLVPMNVVGFGKMYINCEGWDGPGDAYIRTQSCVLHYALIPNPHVQLHMGHRVVGDAVGWVR